MADESSASAAPTTFAEFEAGGGKYNAPASEPAEPVAAEEHSEAPAESVAEPESAEKPIQERPAKKPPASAGPKLTLSEERAKLLREVTELRAQRRELQQQQPIPASQPAPQAGAAVATKPEPAAAEEKPPVRPKLSTFAGTLEEYEAAVDEYEDKQRKWLEQAHERRDGERQAKAERDKLAAEYGKKLADHLKAHPEYDDEVAKTPMSPLMVDIVFSYGPALGQQLIDNKEEARRISSLPRDVQIFEMGKLAAGMNGHTAIPESATETEEAEEPASKPVKIPAKLGATGGASSALSKPDHGAKSFAQWEEMEKRLAKKR